MKESDKGNPSVMMVRKAAGLNWSINLDSWAAEDFRGFKFRVLQKTEVVSRKIIRKDVLELEKLKV
jgi:hypothetical protein